jgi:hypothetical protein
MNMTPSYEAATALAKALNEGATFLEIATDLGRIAVLHSELNLPTFDPVFNAQMGLIMEHGYRDGVRETERSIQD